MNSTNVLIVLLSCMLLNSVEKPNPWMYVFYAAIFLIGILSDKKD